MPACIDLIGGVVQKNLRLWKNNTDGMVSKVEQGAGRQHDELQVRIEYASHRAARPWQTSI